MLNYYLPVVNVFAESKYLNSDYVAVSELSKIHNENTSHVKTMIPQLILESVINQYGSTKNLFSELEHLEAQKNQWLILSFNPSKMKIEVHTDDNYSSSTNNICLVIKSVEEFANIDWDVVRNRYNQIIKLQ